MPAHLHNSYCLQLYIGSSSNELVTNHLSSIPNIFVHDGAIGSSPNCDAKVRVISDSPSALLSLSNFLYKTRTRSVSHDSCPLTVYAATSISPLVVEAIGVGSQSNNGIIAADMERSSLVLCGKAFLDASAVKKTLFLLSEPVISARGGIPLPGRILVSGDSVIVLFAPEDTIQSCTNLLVSSNAGTILTSQSISPSFQTGNTGASNLFNLPTAFVLVSSDSSGGIPTVSKLSPGQAAYHFLAGYQNGKFVPSFSHGPSCIDPLELAKALLAKLRGNHVHSYLININRGKKTLAGKDFVKLVESTLSKDVLPFEAKGGDLERKYKAFLSAKYPELPKDFTF
ncbi:Phosphoenolpyruvate carboxykinase [Senna tora]|uniref:phosphoenolpyruvate carboxykinase (ATP) n=1 Tax=Senna tora TaxID=362788 RepID=A0A834XLW4_9FABA|nr:Phosphoenolpyruvate carboxykinase [Senna tora]